MKAKHLILTSRLLLSGVMARILFLAVVGFISSPTELSAFERNSITETTENFGDFFSVVQFAELSTEKEVDESINHEGGLSHHFLAPQKGSTTISVRKTPASFIDKLRLSVLSVRLSFIIYCHQLKVYC